MAYLTINTNTASGRKLLEELRKRRDVKILKHPNEETRQALRDAKEGKGVKEIKDTRSWLKKLLS